MKLRNGKGASGGRCEIPSDSAEDDDGISQPSVNQTQVKANSRPFVENAAAAAGPSKEPRPKKSRPRLSIIGESYLPSKCPELIPLVIDTCGRQDLFDTPSLCALRATSKDFKSLFDRLFPFTQAECGSSKLENLLARTSLMEKIQQLTVDDALEATPCTQLVLRNPPQLKELTIIDTGSQIEILTCGQFSSLTSLTLRNLNTRNESFEKLGAISQWPLRQLNLVGTGAAVSQALLYGVIEKYPELTELTLHCMDVKKTLKKSYRPPYTLLPKLEILDLKEISNMPKLEITRLFHSAEEGLPSLRSLAITTNKTSVIQDLITASQWLKGLDSLSLYHTHEAPLWQQQNRPVDPDGTDAAAYARLFSSLKGAGLKVLTLDGIAFTESVFKCLELQDSTDLKLFYNPHVHENVDLVASVCAATMPALRSLSLNSERWASYNSNVHGLEGLVAAFPNIKCLSMSMSCTYTDTALYNIGKYVMPYLEELTLSSCRLYHTHFQTLVGYLNETRHVSAALCPSLRALTINKGLGGWHALEILVPIAHHMPNLKRLIFKEDSAFPDQRIPDERARELKKNLVGTWPFLKELKAGPLGAAILKGLWPLAAVS